MTGGLGVTQLTGGPWFVCKKWGWETRGCICGPPNETRLERGCVQSTSRSTLKSTTASGVFQQAGFAKLLRLVPPAGHSRAPGRGMNASETQQIPQLVLDKSFCPAQSQIHEKVPVVQALRNAVQCCLGTYYVSPHFHCDYYACNSREFVHGLCC